MPEFKVKNIIWDLFGVPEDLKDINKNTSPPITEEGKGLNQRFHEALWEDFDDVTFQEAKNFIPNLITPETLYEKYLPLRYEDAGEIVKLYTYVDDEIYLTSPPPSPPEYPYAYRRFLAYKTAFPNNYDLYHTNQIRRKVLKYARRYNKMRGTRINLNALWNLIGVDGVLTEMYYDFSFDYGNYGSPPQSVTFDHVMRRFDMNRCYPCSFYKINLTGPFAQLTDAIIYSILNIWEYNKPINAGEIIEFNYNGAPMSAIIDFWVDQNGDLFYNNLADPELLAYLDELGNLHVSGPNAHMYAMDNEGNVIFTYIV